MTAQTKTAPLAIWSLVLGILAILLSPVLIGFLLTIPAVICGHVAYSRIGRSGGALSGRGLALGGLITGYMSIVLIPIIGLLAAIAIPNFVRARSTAQAHACINNMRQIDGAIQQWALENAKKDPDVLDASAVVRFIKGGVMPTCPAGGLYLLAPTVGTTPTVTCPNAQSTPPHVLQ